jgi:hypothetical protein
MSVQVSYKKQFIFAIILLFSFLIIIEIGARMYDYFEPYCGLKNEKIIYSDIDYVTKSQICESWLSLIWYWDEKTDTYTLEPNQHKSTVNINSHGLRGEEFSAEKPDGEYRIFLVGGSTTASLRAISDDHTPAGYLEKKIDEKYPTKNIEVINAGIPGFTSTQEKKLIENKIVNLEPDLIIIYDGTNDVNLPYGFIPHKGSLRDVLSDVINRYLPFWETVPVIYHFITQSTQEIEKQVFDNSDIELKASTWANNHKSVCELGKIQGYETIILLQPILGTGERDLTQWEQKQFEYFDQSKVISAYELFAKKLNNLDKNCMMTNDLRNIMDNVKGDVYFDNAHIGYQNNEIVAEKIFKLIKPIIEYN